MLWALLGGHVLYATSAIIERVEGRCLFSTFSFWVEDHILYVVGSGKLDVDDSITLDTYSVHLNYPDATRVVIDGRGGNDRIQMSVRQPHWMPVTIRGGTGNDAIFIAGERVTVLGGSGDDEIMLDFAHAVAEIDGPIDGGEGIDTIVARGRAELDLNEFTGIENGTAPGKLIGTAGPNVLTSLPLYTDREVFSSTVFGAGGDDTIHGAQSPNRLDGGDGNDRVFGDVYGDRLEGGAGNDTLYGFDGNDTLNGRSGRDRLIGGNGRDRLAGNGDHDWLFGESDVDRLYGGDGNDYLDGGSSGDRLYGNAGLDILHGNGGNDNLFSIDSIADQLFGGKGDDKARVDSVDAVADIEQFT